MFGPDKCGEDYKLHFIFRHQNPLNKDLEEKHAKRPDVDLKKFYTDKKTHLYTLGTETDWKADIFYMHLKWILFICNSVLYVPHWSKMTLIDFENDF